MKTPVEEFYEFMNQNQYFIGNDLYKKYQALLEKEKEFIYNGFAPNMQGYSVLVSIWASEKGLSKRSDGSKQMLKVTEEIGELAAALARNNMEDAKDAIGDSFVTLIILSRQLGFTPSECLEAAWEEIKDRTGKTENGVFIKD